MSDSHLLRLAKLVEEVCWNTFATSDTRNDDARQLVRDLEAAEATPAPRTITRAQYDEALDRCCKLRDRNTSARAALDRILREFNLTVEDA